MLQQVVTKCQSGLCSPWMWWQGPWLDEFSPFSSLIIPIVIRLEVSRQFMGIGMTGLSWNITIVALSAAKSPSFHHTDVQNRGSIENGGLFAARSVVAQQVGWYRGMCFDDGRKDHRLHIRACNAAYVFPNSDGVGADHGGCALYHCPTRQTAGAQ